MAKTKITIEMGYISQTGICTGVQAGASWFSRIITISERYENPRGKDYPEQRRENVLCGIEGKTVEEVDIKSNMIFESLRKHFETDEGWKAAKGVLAGEWIAINFQI